MYNLVGKKYNEQYTEIQIGDIVVGRDFLVIAGPCSVESEEQIMEIAFGVKDAGANMLRGGAYKPRTSPYAFQGLGRTGVEYLKRASLATDLPIITEVMDTRDVEFACDYVDVIQIGARNMQNFSLLKEIGKTNVPILLKRGLSATIEEWLGAAEYIMKQGNEKVILCERGIRTFETYTRNTLDLSTVSALKHLTHLPVIVDPSHATGRSELVETMSLSAIMAGGDGLEIEVHSAPEMALSDNQQQLKIEQFKEIMSKIQLTVKFRQTLK